MITKKIMLIGCLLLAGCQTVPEVMVPVVDDQPKNEARIFIRPHYVSLGGNFVAIFMGGGTTPFTVSLFDVTGDPVYLGKLKSPGVLRHLREKMFVYDTAPGKKILMLHMKKYDGGDFIDFLEVETDAGSLSYVNISQHGMYDRPYFRSNNFNSRVARECTYSSNISKEKLSQIFGAEQYDSIEKDKGFCVRLANYTTSNKVALVNAWPGDLAKESVQNLKAKYYSRWIELSKKGPPYDLTSDAIKTDEKK
jgi:hypothetical protein